MGSQRTPDDSKSRAERKPEREKEGREGEGEGQETGGICQRTMKAHR